MQKQHTFVRITTTVVAILALAGCATSGNIAPQYVNPSNYQSYNCSSLQSEIARISQTAELVEKQNIGLSATGLGIGIAGGRHGIYPTVSMGMGANTAARNAKKDELARLYGQHDAMVVAARGKGCAFAQSIKIYGEK